MFKQVIDLTVIGLALFYVARNPQSFSSVINAISSLYSSAVKTLQGR